MRGSTGMIWKDNSLFRFYSLHQSIVIGAICGLGLLTFLAMRGLSTTGLIASWNLGALIYIGLTWRRMLAADAERLRHRAAKFDFSDSLILVLASLAALASMGGIAAELHGVDKADGPLMLARVAVAIATIAVSWFFLHTLFTVHYAHRYYAADDGGSGLKFPDAPLEPEFWDFLYFAFTIGVASQTADVSVTSTPMRKVTLLHSILSFLFNTTVLALAVNVGASLI